MNRLTLLASQLFLVAGVADDGGTCGRRSDTWRSLFGSRRAIVA
jgi:hypothetical protein